MKTRCCKNCKYWNVDCIVTNGISDCDRPKCLGADTTDEMPFYIKVGVDDDQGLDYLLMTGMNFCCDHFLPKKTINILYIIDTSKPFDGTHVNCICNDNLASNHSIPFDDYRKLINDPHLIAINEEEMATQLQEYRLSLIKEFEEISYEQYQLYLNGVPPLRFGHWKSSFFVGSPYEFDLHMLCFQGDDGKYYCGLRSIKLSDSEIVKMINDFKQPI